MRRTAQGKRERRASHARAETYNVFPRKADFARRLRPMRMLARVFRQCAIVSGLAESAAIMVRRYGNERVSRPVVMHAKRRLRDPSIGDVFAVEKGRVEKAAQIGAQPLRQRVEVLDVSAFIAHFSYIRDRRLRKSAQLCKSVLRHFLLIQ